MKNSGIVGIIILFIIGYAIMAIGVVGAIIGLAAGLFYIIKWIIKTIHQNRLRLINKTVFYEYIVQHYELIDNSTDGEKIDNKLSSAISQIISLQSVNSQLNDGFSSFKSVYKNAVNNSSMWYNVDLLQGDSCNSNSLSRYKFSFQDKGFLDVIGSGEHPFLLKTKNQCFYFYPNFVIAEVNCEYKIIEYNDLSIKNIDSIYVTEQSGKIIRGASPVFYNYLHQRVDGGPDRRYKNNPSTPVYCHTICRLFIGVECQIISATSDSVDLLRRGLREYQEALIANPIQCENKSETLLTDSKQGFVSDMEVSDKNYAYLFKEIIDERGKNILNERLFLSLLADYKVFKEKRFLRPFLETMTEEGYWTELTEGNPSVDTLNRIKKKFITIHQYPEHEVTEAMAYIGYGLGITA